MYVNDKLPIVTRVYLYSDVENSTQRYKVFFFKMNFELLRIHNITIILLQVFYYDVYFFY